MPEAVQIIREADDPLALRASIGGRDDIGWYLVYRGAPLDVLAMLRRVMCAAERELGMGQVSSWRHSPLCSGTGIAPNPGCSCGLVEWLYREVERALDGPEAG